MTTYFVFTASDTGMKLGLFRRVESTTLLRDEQLADGGIWLATDRIMSETVNPSMDYDLVQVTEARAREIALDEFGVTLAEPQPGPGPGLEERGLMLDMDAASQDWIKNVKHDP